MNSAKNFSFAVLGDTHLIRKESHERVLSDENDDGYNDLSRYLWMTNNIIPKILAEIAEQKPEFMLHTGDIIPGPCDKDEDLLLEMRQGLEVLSKARAPLIFAPGTHDGEPGGSGECALNELVYPLVSQAVNKTIDRGYYLFEVGNCFFISLDYRVWTNEQYDFFVAALEESVKYTHVFVFAHPPVIPIARPFFTDIKFAANLASLFEKYRVSAYFCGHTHNQAATIHKFGSNTTAQLMSTPLGFIDLPVLLSDVRPLLPDENSYEYGWGYMENSMPSWLMVDIADDVSTIKWNVLGRGVIGEIVLSSLGEAKFIKKPDYMSQAGRLPDMNSASRIKEIKLFLSGAAKPYVNIEYIKMNGITLPKPSPIGSFCGHGFVTIPKDKWKYISEKNTIVIKVTGESQSIGSCSLAINDGNSIIRSSVSGYFTNKEEYLVNSKFQKLNNDGEARFVIGFKE